MTHIAIEREALQTVLDTLEENHHLIEQYERAEYLALYDRQITVIKKALAAQPAPMQEPMMYEDWYDPSSCGHCGMVNGHAPKCRHNYKPPAQRQWVGLSEEEILKLAYPIRWQEVDDFEADKAVNFAQLVEAKLKEKNT